MKKTVSFVEAEHEVYTRESDPLKQCKSMNAAVFRRKEIVTGELVGSGGFADVYEIKSFILQDDVSSQLTLEQRDARQKMADSAIINGKSQYVIKFLQSDLLVKPILFHRAATYFASEAHLSSVLKHPGINGLKGISIDGFNAYADGRHDSFFLITERLTETLESRIERWSTQPQSDASLQDKVKIAHQLAEVLRYLHENRVVFRDLKPCNIGFSAVDDSLKLFDFGLSRKLPKRKMSGQVYVMSGVGSYRYMAPEVIRQFPYNCTVDIYGWGMIFWQMIHLQKPYADLSPDEHEVSVGSSGHRPLISSCFPPSIQRVLEQTWDESSWSRLTAADLINELIMIQDELNFLD